MYRTLKVEAKSRVATVTLNRPEARNAMSTQLMREMIACAGRIGSMREIDVVILRGAGKYFSAGRDLKDARSWYGSGQTLDQQREMSSLGFRMARAWEEMPQI